MILEYIYSQIRNNVKRFYISWAIFFLSPLASFRCSVCLSCRIFLDLSSSSSPTLTRFFYTLLIPFFFSAAYTHYVLPVYGFQDKLFLVSFFSILSNMKMIFHYALLLLLQHDRNYFLQKSLIFLLFILLLNVIYFYFFFFVSNLT